MKTIPYVLTLVVLSYVTVMSPHVHACKIPVFRYALERWPPDAYEVAILHRGPLSDSDNQLVEKLREAAQAETNPANVTVLTVDLDQQASAEGAGESLAKKYGHVALPHMVVHYPPLGPERWEAWSGLLGSNNVNRLIDSPLRRQIIERLLAGDSAVWVLIECGDAKQDDAAEETLRQELKRMEQTLELPPLELLEAEQEFQYDTAVELRIGFTLFRLRRDDPSEQAFLSMLLRSESDLMDFQEPIVIPIFGRGRTFFALVGRGIDAGNIEDSCRFICGDCSCQVKQQNPGIDMLFAVNWDESVRGSAFRDVELPELTGVGGLEIFDLGPLGESDEAVAESQTADADATENADTRINDIQTTQETVPSTDDSNADAQLAMANVSPERGEQITGIDASVKTGDSVPVDSPRQFGRTLLQWLLVAATAAAVVILGTSLWIKSRHQV